MAYYDFLSIIFAPLLKLHPVLAIFIVSLLFSFLTLIITKYTTDQNSMKRIKEQTNELRKSIKEFKKEPSKSAEMQKKIIEMNKLSLEQLRHSFKPMLITSIPIIFLLIPWMSSIFAYESIKPNEEFSVTVFLAKNSNGQIGLIASEGITVVDDKIKKIENSKSTWTLKGEEGEHIMEFVYGNEKQQKSILITTSNKYLETVKKTNGTIKSIQINYKKLVILPIGYKDWFGWLGTYIIFSIIFTMILRKVMKVY